MNKLKRARESGECLLNGVVYTHTHTLQKDVICRTLAVNVYKCERASAAGANAAVASHIIHVAKEDRTDYGPRV